MAIVREFFEENRLPKAAAAAALAVGEFVYLDSNGTWSKADATATTAMHPADGVVIVGCASGGTPEVGRSARIDGLLTGATKGNTIYLGKTAGTCVYASADGTLPGSTGDIVQALGYAINATDAYINLGSSIYMVHA